MKNRKTANKKISKYFREFKAGDRVAIVKDLSVTSAFPKQIYGLTGRILARRGRSYLVALKDKDKEKQYIVKPVHLKKL